MPFSRDSLVFTCVKVADDGDMVGFVIRDEDRGDGREDWTFLCGENHVHDEDSIRVLHAQHVLQREPELLRLSGLQCGCTAFRLDGGKTWLVSRTEGAQHDAVSAVDLSDATQCLCCDAAHRERGADGYDAAERNVLEHIARTGLHIWQISPDESNDGFSYSVGMSASLGAPDIIVFGQQPEWQASLINFIAERVRAGSIFEDGCGYPEIIPGYDCAFRTIKTAESYNDFLGWWTWYYSTVAKIEPPLVLQAVWPDMQSRFPWDDGYHGKYRQPLLP